MLIQLKRNFITTYYFNLTKEKLIIPKNPKTAIIHGIFSYIGNFSKYYPIF